MTCIKLSISIRISISFSIAQTPTVRPRAHYIVIISCYSEQYARLKRSVFSPRRKADASKLTNSVAATRLCLALRQYVPRSLVLSLRNNFPFSAQKLRFSLRLWRFCHETPAVRNRPPPARTKSHFFFFSYACHMNHNWSAMKQRLHPQSVAEISRHSVLSGDRIRQCGTPKCH